MSSRPSEGAPFPDARQWKPCSHCGAPNPPRASGCVQCRQPFPHAHEAAAAEIAHVDYLLQQLPGWRQHGLLSDSAHTRLRSDYLHLQQQLADTLFPQQRSQSNAAQPDVVASDTFAAVDGVAPTPPFAAPDAPTLWAMDLPGIAPGWSAAPAGALPQTLPFVPSSAAQHPPVGKGLRQFFQKHALQVLFALATVLVLAALRAMLGWTWIGDVVMRLLPVVPLGLTAMFWMFGQKTRDENPWAAFAYHGLAAALSAFDVIALNKYWLPAPLAAKPALLLAALVALAVSGALFRQWREVAYLHLFQVAALTTAVRPHANPAVPCVARRLPADAPVAVRRGISLLRGALSADGALVSCRRCRNGYSPHSCLGGTVMADGMDVLGAFQRDWNRIPDSHSSCAGTCRPE